ncbi:MAG TPA: tripartite tricarboxylate transporter substrate-binding protein [Alphaproteobacteria bacterium]|nr:tripartite tricarboxylate transporter substrate-binding protein [Alphaproteobacteria bacterium]
MAGPSLRLAAVIGAALPLVAFVSFDAGAESVADFYKAKGLTILVGSGAGGGYDVYARTFARHYARHIPGTPNIVIKDMPGAGGLRVTNYIARKAARDGSEIAATAGPMTTAPLIDTGDFQFDPRTLEWIGSLAGVQTICFTWHTSGIKTLAQAREREVVVGAAGARTASATVPRIFNALVGTKFKIVGGYATDELRLAVERGETQGICGLAYSTVMASQPDWIVEKKIDILAQFGLKKDPQMPNVPLATAFASSADAERIMELILIRQEMGRPFVAPPGIPADRLAVLRRAFDRTVTGPGYRADAKRARLPVNAMDAADMKALIAKAYDAPKDIVARTVKLLADIQSSTKHK